MAEPPPVGRYGLILVLLETRFDNLPEPGRLSSERSGAGFDGPADPYQVPRVAPYGLDGGRHEHARRLEAAIAAAGRELRRFPGFRPAGVADELAEANGDPYRWERARRLMYERFDYRALDVAVALLHEALPGCPARSRRGLAFIEPRMPDPIRAPPPPVAVNAAASGRWADPRARAQRDRRVRVWAAQGRPLGEIAAELGLSYRQVRRIVEGQEAA